MQSVASSGCSRNGVGGGRELGRSKSIRPPQFPPFLCIPRTIIIALHNTANLRDPVSGTLTLKAEHREIFVPAFERESHCITRLLVAILAGWNVPFVCTQTHELGEKIVASYLYEVHLHRFVRSSPSPLATVE